MPIVQRFGNSVLGDTPTAWLSSFQVSKVRPTLTILHCPQAKRHTQSSLFRVLKMLLLKTPALLSSVLRKRVFLQKGRPPASSVRMAHASTAWQLGGWHQRMFKSFGREVGLGMTCPSVPSCTAKAQVIVDGCFTRCSPTLADSVSPSGA